MSLTKQVVNTSIKGLTSLICRVEDRQLSQVPLHGPLIIVANHINFLDVPVIYTRLFPRPISAFAKAETWDNPALAFIFDLWDAIPLRRGEADLHAIRRGLAELEASKILAVAPEGTRSGHGRLQKGHPGVVLLALNSGAPLQPLAYYGGENFRFNIRSLKRTDFNIVVGNPFHLRSDQVKVNREIRQQMTDEIMYQLAALLPSRYRGDYANLSAASETYLHFPPSSESNLRRAITS